MVTRVLGVGKGKWFWNYWGVICGGSSGDHQSGVAFCQKLELCPMMFNGYSLSMQWVIWHFVLGEGASWCA